MLGMVLVDGTEEGKSKAGVDDGVGIPKACRYLFSLLSNLYYLCYLLLFYVIPVILSLPSLIFQYPAH